ncbi:hypothetical protein EXQ31_05090 [Clostridium botulinum]|uniref:hypothetical protein n=1 Tax=Clostridium botulinum TaxID=1491 RepID=UPI001A938180|nr:hypothetical protein [Clostridium botulinum]MBO0525887.1 hypothetical protein [Clostridium botulinum]MBO0528485.1 hypothetical protein [Clostridium botulinum]MBO0531874.1 hypothetical protein [Clostridium botulinum]MBO0533975.1 hypothetical protein [Clostridium botulinum]MBO0539824.1 hypothetical protein [Clostridium botulinum]
MKLTRDKVVPIFKKAEFDIMYNEGVSKEGSLMDIAIEIEMKYNLKVKLSQILTIVGKYDLRIIYIICR